MGGYGSGTEKKHHITDEYIPIDTMYLLKQKLLTGKLRQGGNITFTSTSRDMKGKMTEKHHTLSCIVERYEDKGGKWNPWDASGQLTLLYIAKQGDWQKTFSPQIPLVVTRPYIGGVRWWFLSPCCGSRVRVLYIPTS